VNWEAVGAIGEILGAAAVVATLYYVSRQIRQNSLSLDRANEYAQASSIHESNALYVQIFAPLVQDSEMASIYYRALAGETLDETEATRFSLFVKTYMVWAEDLYYQQETELGFAAVADVVVLLDTIGPYINRLLSAHSGRTWWETDARHHLSPPFFEVIDRVVMHGESFETPGTTGVAP
jgi:hypothetical protein